MPNINYTRPIGRKKYISIEKHQSTARNKYAKWISINVERDLFDYADYGNFTKIENNPIDIEWTCTSSNNMWSLLPNKNSVGQDNEQFGFFQRPVNDNDDWHGFPVIPFSKSRYNISKDLLNLWVEKGVISIDDISSIVKRKRI
ncbi:hypothetical protein SAMN05421856_105116 [Chryseobacterium taichungense]|uniref:Uncharacterized protein n=1 Tax=Chryseobacterium taichungense TaxID=295069 RepID=A0A1H8A5E6_9FLAO|nr:MULTISPECIES: hypothetical protein [Chryseobacterium]MDQ1858301.1 hypothetical protein [Chryseobacterium sp. WLY505]SEM65783.1 hypothetical protein SAMN05421856_105116 [Chryseobacterium taichungense]